MTINKTDDPKSGPDNAPGVTPKALPAQTDKPHTESKKSADQARHDKAFPQADAAEVLKARKDGHLEAIKDNAKLVYASGGEQEYGGSTGTQRFQGASDVANIEYFVDLPEEQLKKMLKGEHAMGGITDARAAGLLEVERSGKNRSHVVDLLCNHLGIDSPYEATDAGPPYTNDTSLLKAVKPRPQPKAA